ncbi:tRNA lysidine(34) synthetase TilS [Candidatus Dependentiae bacterium HGW-Dependentiae-1]|nr:MAG: tRNA lysidine(34) synthetase TilS [Candidatus Dependentiae bacterium HGW-Dependentiae-1]
MKKSLLFTTIQAYSDNNDLLPTGSTVVLGLSGGPDSLFLLHVLHEWHTAGHIKLIAAHLDHAWRPESASEALFCQHAATALGIPFIQARLSDLDFTPQWRGSKEDLGRKARRFFLESVAREQNADRIALAHHAQDQQETFFIRLLRGATLTGLTGMKPKQGLYIRPLLLTNKAEILAYLHEQNITYVTDPSNESPIFLRNRIRATVIPALRSCDERFDKNFLSTITRLQETETFLDTLAQEILTQISTSHEGITRIDIPTFLATPPILRYRILLTWLCQHQLPFEPTQAFLDEIIRFLAHERGGKHALHTSWHLVKRSQEAWLEKNAA